jgi:hypothetical protein
MLLAKQKFSIECFGKDANQCAEVSKALAKMQTHFSPEEIIEFSAKIQDKSKVDKIRNFKHML